MSNIFYGPVLGIDEHSIILKLYTIDEPYTLERIANLWPANHPEKLQSIALSLANLVNKGLVSTKQVGEEESRQRRVWELSVEGRSYLEDIWAQQARKSEEEDINFNKLKDDAAVSKWVRRTYVFTFIAAIVGAVTGIVTLIIQLIDKFK